MKIPVVMITGASRGLGRALADEFEARQAQLILHSKSESVIPFVPSVKGDISSAVTIEELRLVGEKYGVDILINNAGIHTTASFSEMNYTQIRETIAVNLLGPMLLTNALWPELMKSKGMIINISSLAAIVGGDGESVYGASKAGLSGFSKSLQFDGIRDGVRVLDICLGAMQTDMARDRKDFEKLIDPCDAAATIVDLCTYRDSMRITELTIARRNY